MSTSPSRIRPIVEGALMLALATILGYMYLYRLPQGGSFDLALVPIFLYCLRWGPKWSFGACFIHGLLQYFLGGGIAISWQSMFLDYLLAETLLGFCGFAAGKRGGWIHRARTRGHAKPFERGIAHSSIKRFALVNGG